MSVGTTTLSVGQSFVLRLSQLAFTMSQALSLRKLTDMMNGTTNLSQEPVWLLGTYYGVGEATADAKALDAEALEALLTDFHSRLWLTYRKDFPNLGPSMLTSDIGWGCTIRSGQMLLAEAVARITLGRSWIKAVSSLDDIQPVIELFLDHPDAPLSIHRICEAGVSAGIVPGRWVGPWMLCKSLEALWAQLGSQRPMGLHLHVACGSGGGAPELNTASLRASLAGSAAAPELQVSGPEGTGSEGRATEAVAPSCGLGSSPRSEDSGSGAGDRAGEAGAVAGPCGPAGDAAPAGQSGAPSDTVAAAGTAGMDVARAAVEPGDPGGPGEQSGSGLADEAVPPTSTAGRDMPCNGTAATAAGATEAEAVGGGRRGQQQQEQLREGGTARDGGSSVTGAAADEAPAPAPGGEPTTGIQPADVGSESSRSAAGGSGRPSCEHGRAGDSGENSGGEEGLSGGAQQAGAGRSQRTPAAASAAASVLILVPLTLGMDKINPVYVPQLQQILTWPQTVGIVGGRPSASLYLCGLQDGSFLYLDPHEAQPAVRPPGPPGNPAGSAARGGAGARTGTAAAATAVAAGAQTSAPSASSSVAAASVSSSSAGSLPAASLGSYFCDVVRLLPATALDPSMAIGFVCSGAAELEDLLSRLEALARDHSAAPLMTLSAGARAGAGAGADVDFEDPDNGTPGAARQELEEWELV